MSASDWLAGIGGAARGVDETRREDARIELQKMLAQIAADTSTENNKRTTAAATQRAANSDETKRAIADGNREQRANAVIANTNLGYSRISSNEGLGHEREAGRNNRADNSLGYLWEKLNEDQAAKYAGQDVTMRGQNMSAATAARGQDLTHEDRGAALDQGANATRARTALGILGVKARQKPALFGDNADPTDWAAEYDRLYNQPDDAGADAASPTSVPARPAMPSPRAAPTSAPGMVPGEGLPPRPAMPALRAPGASGATPQRGMPTGRQSPPAPGGPTGVAAPPAVLEILKGQKPAHYTLSDGSTWVVGADGSVTPGR